MKKKYILKSWMKKRNSQKNQCLETVSVKEQEQENSDSFESDSSQLPLQSNPECNKIQLKSKYKDDPVPPDPDPPVPPPPSLLLKQIGPYASPVRIVNHQVSIGFPRLSVTIYPGQSMRLNTGWQLNTIPSGNLLHTSPHPVLLDYNVLAFPQVFDQSNSGNQIVQVVLNNNDFPISFSLPALQQNQNGQTKMVKVINQNSNQTILQFNFGNFLTGLVSVASQVLPAIAGI